ncbi:MAG TPA: FAD-dependent monooxygenase [Pseudonocardiaceae bacterium]|jgi:2-polyprenyl-6-methoxyphenol hydroxylase-like FAD-dependent oxidoreductase|nr:FAD-dependent monooxygenase [Pseudonocardiaceae bacterium]
MLPTNVEVLVAGGGPTGLVLASVLRRAGRDVVALDKQQEGANASRAAAIHARTLEVLAELGVTETLVEQGVVVPTFTFRDRDRVLTRLDFASLPSPYPFVLTLQQNRTEAILTKSLREAGGDVLRPYEVTGVRPDGAGATVTVEGPDGVETVYARFVVGADGLHSRVRDQVGIGFAGGDYQQSFVLADAQVDWPLRFDEVQNFFSPAGIVVSGPLPDDHRRVLATVEHEPAAIDIPFVQQILDERGPTGARVTGLSWTSRFRVHHRIAATFRSGPVFLAGDAAHVHSPAGGQGMNLGIQDAVDLGHTLAAALDGTALDGTASGEDHLDGYERRRRPIAKATVGFTNMMTKASIVRNRPAQTVRNAAFSLVGHLPPARRQMALHMSELA